jgi:hypothetical protein
MKTRTGKTLIVTAAVCSTLLMLSGTAAAHSSVDFNVSVGIPGVVYGPAYGPVYAPAPEVVYAPQPVYYPPPVYYSPAGYYSGDRWEGRHQREWQRREWHERHHGHHWHEDDD